MNRRHAKLHQRLDQIADQTIHSKPSYRRIKRFLALAALLGNAVLIVSFAPSGLPEGSVRVGRLLVSNFNDSGNIQGNGTTIVAVNPANRKVELFFQGTPATPLGFSNALTVATAGFVFAGSVSHQRPWRHDS